MTIRLQFTLGLLLIATTAIGQPTITSVTPASGPVGASITITGTNFSTTPANNIVYFGTGRATVNTATATQLTVTVPVGASPQYITVLVGGLVAYSARPFVVTFNGDVSNFAARVNLTAVGGPQSVSIGDLDGDGKADLATANFSGSLLSVFRNTSIPGTISFAALPDISFSIPNAISIADVDGDGKADLMATSANLNVLSIYRNTSTIGNISFATKVDLVTSNNPQAIGFGDFDGDGKIDVAVSIPSQAAVQISRNTSTPGTISFATASGHSVGAAGSVPYTISIADLDGDGKVDLATANDNGTVGVLRNTSTTGTISFATRVNLTAGGQPRSVAIGDLDGDGKADLAVANSSVNTVSVLRNTSTTGVLSFDSKIDITASNGPYSIAIGDVNGDGLNDLVVGNVNSNNASVFDNTSTVGSISFAAKADFVTNAGPRSVALSDLDGDGKLDIFAGSTSALGSVHQNTTKIKQTISFGALAAKAFDDAPFALSATASSALPVSYASSNPAVATVSGNTVTIVAVGTTTITASQAGNTTYAPATNVLRLLTVNKANQTITFGTLAAKTFGDASFNLTATSSAALAVSYVSSNPLVATVSGNSVTIVGAGTTTITASQAGNANYNPATDVPQVLTINKANQTITFTTLTNKVFGDTPFVLTATSSSGLPVSYTSSNTSAASVAGNTVTISNAGSTLITASQAGNTNYNPATNVVQSLTINKANQTIMFTALTPRAIGDVFTLTATATSSLPLTYTSSNPAVATVTGNTVTALASGTATITALQAGNSNFNPASNVPQNLLVKQGQTITFAVLPDKTVGESPFNLTATASSNLPVSFSTTSTKITLAGNQVTIVSAGRASITAMQSGDANYAAAISVDRSFCIKPAKPTVTLTNPNTTSPTLTSNASSGNQWYLNGTAINGATNPTLTITQAGIYKVQVQVDDCISAFSDDQPLIVTAVEPGNTRQLTVYPNPAGEELIIALNGFENSKPVAIKVMDLLGRQFESTTGKGGEEIRIDIRHYQGGQYVLLMTQGHTRVTKKFIKTF